MSPETADQTQRFYDALASEYDLIFADWQASVRRQAEILDRIIRGQLAVPRTLWAPYVGAGCFSS